MSNTTVYSWHKMKKNSEIKRAQNRLWKLTSEYVRRRDANENGIVKCCTCDKTGHWTEFDAGHFIAKNKGNSIRWDLTNIHTQCTRCNRFLHGNLIIYYQYIEMRYGKGYADNLVQKSNNIVKLKLYDYEQMIENVKGLFDNLD